MGTQFRIMQDCMASLQTREYFLLFSHRDVDATIAKDGGRKHVADEEYYSAENEAYGQKDKNSTK